MQFCISMMFHKLYKWVEYWTVELTEFKFMFLDRNF